VCMFCIVKVLKVYVFCIVIVIKVYMFCIVTMVREKKFEKHYPRKCYSEIGNVMTLKRV
jgi:Ni,Fe-hydrogenase I cytochrome b subunit